ncbi:MAG: bile acid:sodium symporter, partial [Rhizobiaceae bacterium]|nr:bile acid:sodium symporter [Rhizobiaceae bacterium]
MRRFLPDTFTMLLVLTVITASFFPVQGSSAHYFSIATNFAIGLLFFLHGARLSRDVVIAGLLHWRLHVVILLTTFGVFPLLVLAMGHIVPDSILPVSLYTGMLFLSVLPSTVQSSIAFTSIAGGNVPAAICAASASNIFGMFLTPLLVGVLFSVGGHGGFSWDVLEQIMLQLLAPFIAGQLLQPWIGNWIRSKKKILMPVDRGSILMVVYSAFSEAVVEGLWLPFSVVDIVTVIIANMVLLAMVLCITMFGSRALGFSKPDEITITFCGSKKSLASGVPMANVIFAGQGIGA